MRLMLAGSCQVGGPGIRISLNAKTVLKRLLLAQQPQEAVIHFLRHAVGCKSTSQQTPLNGGDLLEFKQRIVSAEAAAQFARIALGIQPAYQLHKIGVDGSVIIEQFDTVRAQG